MRPLLLTALVLLSACARPAETLLVCHNSNCIGPADPERDDSLDAMRESLALRDASGRPMLDGTEMDTFWVGSLGVCAFSHGMPEGEPVPASAAVEEIGKYLRAQQIVTHRAERFHVFMEMKMEVSASAKDLHTPEQAEAHADCVLDLLQKLEDAAKESHHPVQAVVTSFEPALLDALTHRPHWRGKEPSAALSIKLGAIEGPPPPLSGSNRPIAKFSDDVDLYEMHPQWLTDAHLQAIRSQGKQLGMWMFSATSETLHAITKWEPEIVVSSEAPLLRRWLDGP